LTWSYSFDKINFDYLTHSAKYRVGEFDFDTTRFPRGKWGFLRKSSGSGPPHGGVPTSGANSRGDPCRKKKFSKIFFFRNFIFQNPLLTFLSDFWFCYWSWNFLSRYEKSNTVQTPCKHGANTVRNTDQNRCKHGANTVQTRCQTRCKHGANTVPNTVQTRCKHGAN
jgi:hypothetical protein